MFDVNKANACKTCLDGWLPLRNRPEMSSRFDRSESRQDFRNCGVPKLLASFATEFILGLFLKWGIHVDVTRRA